MESTAWECFWSTSILRKGFGGIAFAPSEFVAWKIPHQRAGSCCESLNPAKSRGSTVPTARTLPARMEGWEHCSGKNTINPLKNNHHLSISLQNICISPQNLQEYLYFSWESAGIFVFSLRICRNISISPFQGGWIRMWGTEVHREKAWLF